MVLVDKAGKLYDPSDLELLSNIGTTANVYKLNDNEVLKVSKSPFGISPDVVDINNNFFEKTFSFLENRELLMDVEKGVPMAYISKRYEESGIPLLFEEKERFLEIIASLDADFQKMSEAKIYLYDCFLRVNFILSNSLTIIDTWGFNFDGDYDLVAKNRHLINVLIEEAIISDIMQQSYYKDVCEYFAAIKPQLDVTKELEPQYRRLLKDVDSRLVYHFK